MAHYGPGNEKYWRKHHGKLTYNAEEFHNCIHTMNRISTVILQVQYRYLLWIFSELYELPFSYKICCCFHTHKRFSFSLLSSAKSAKTQSFSVHFRCWCYTQTRTETLGFMHDVLRSFLRSWSNLLTFHYTNCGAPVFAICYWLKFCVCRFWNNIHR